MHISLICTDDDIWALGMRSISSTLKEKGHQTRLIFARLNNGNLNGRILEDIRSLTENSDIIGISSMSRSSKKAKEVIAALKLLKTPVVWGGMHPTLYPEDCVGHADLICRGEGEEFLVELAERIAAGKDWKDIRNGGYRENGGVVLNPIRPLLGDLDELAMYDFSFADEYHPNGSGLIKKEVLGNVAEPILFSGSRGCAFHCNYCSNAALKKIYEGQGRYVRRMSISKIIEDVRKIKERIPKFKYIYFTDEDFFARNINEIKEFAELYPSQVGLPFECMASPPQITDEKMELLVKAGLWKLDVGVESGSDRVKAEIYNRHIPNKVVLKAAQIINKYPQVVPHYFFIIGNPYEEKEDLLETISLLRILPTPFLLRTYNLVLIPGTILYEKAVQDGIIKGMEDSGFEMDFLGGLDYNKHEWKKKNLYLNGLIFMMTGKATRYKIGFLPRLLFPLMTQPKIINFNERHQTIIKSFIGLMKLGLSLRRMGSKLGKKILRDPRSVYNLKRYLYK